MKTPDPKHVCFVTALIGFIWLSSVAHAWQFTPLFDPALLKDIDTIVVVPDGIAGPVRPPRHPTANDSATDAVRNTFEQQPWITVKDETQSADVSKPNVVFLVYNLSSTSAVIDHKTVSIASLTVQFARLSSDSIHRYIPAFYMPPRSYAFVVPHGDEEYLSAFDDAFTKLLSNLPQYFACGNKKIADACARLDPYYGESGPHLGDPVPPSYLKKHGASP